MRVYGSALPDDGRHWQVRPVRGQAALKAYRCPGCDHEIAVGQPHLVTWPDEQVDDRRHWHTACWRRVAG